MIKAILFDLGGTLWNDYPAELAYWTMLAEELTTDGYRLALDDFTRVMPEVIASYCPSLTEGILHKLLGAGYEELPALDRARSRIYAEFDRPDRLLQLKQLYPGVPEVLQRLHQQYLLAVASQHSGRMRRWLKHFELGDVFTEIGLTDRGLAKPDPRFYEQIITRLEVDPEETAMVGDRLDNDIWPARQLGMRTVRILSEPWRLQQPRYCEDQPDTTIDTFSELESALSDLR